MQTAATTKPGFPFSAHGIIHLTSSFANAIGHTQLCAADARAPSGSPSVRLWDGVVAKNLVHIESIDVGAVPLVSSHLCRSIVRVRYFIHARLIPRFQSAGHPGSCGPAHSGLRSAMSG